MAQRTRPIAGILEYLTRQSYTTLFTLWLEFAFGFALAYFALATYLPEHGPIQFVANVVLEFTLIDALYYSIITATSVGYGDIIPQGFSKILATLQSVTALMIFAVFVTKLVSQKQELALQEVHRLTFEDGFHNTREGLYIARKDIDRVIQKLEGAAQLNSEDWADVTIAYEQIQTLVSEIPDFYANDAEENPSGIYTIDEKRQRLLHEAVRRTLRRVGQLLETFNRSNVDWMAHEESRTELAELVRIVEFVTPLWFKETPYKERSFDDLIKLNQTIKEWMEQTEA